MKPFALFFLLLIVGSAFSIMITGDFDEKKLLETSELLPSRHDILLMDLPAQKMKMKTKEVFQFVYNSDFSEEVGSFPIHGVILEDTRRLVIPVVLKYKKKSIRTTCVLDTGSPWTFISRETFRAIGIMDVNEYAQIAVHGLPIPVYESTNHFADINLCGQSFLGDNLLKLTVDFRRRKVMVEETTKLSKSEIEEL